MAVANKNVIILLFVHMTIKHFQLLTLLATTFKWTCWPEGVVVVLYESMAQYNIEGCENKKDLGFI